jgi:carbon-monoxide dehydrogenase large subunit
MREAIVGRHVGARVKRVEDARLLSGHGRYVDDVTVPGMLHAAFLRSPYAHAELRTIEVAAARSLQGVVAVLTGADLQALTNPMMGMLSLAGLYDPWYWPLAVDRVRLVGDPVAVVVAESRAIAEDACELIDVEYEPLQAIATIDQALDPSRPAVWPKNGSNVIYQTTDTYGDVDAAMAGAHRIVQATFRQHRHANQPMETRGIIAEVDPVDGELTIHGCHQAAHLLKWATALILAKKPGWRSALDLVHQRQKLAQIGRGIKAFLAANPTLIRDTRPLLPIMGKQIARDPKRLQHLGRAMLGLMATQSSELPHVLTGDIGGAFGAKTTVLREEVTVCAAARHLGRSIKWIEDRNEHLTVGGQARDEEVEIAAGVTADGGLLGITARLTMDAGAYPGFPYGAPLFARVIKTMLPGPYRIGALRFETRVVASNKASYVAYRGPWAVETWVRERLLDVIASELGLSRASVRLRNMIGPDELPTTMITGPQLDVRMSAKMTLEKALVLADFDGWEKAKAAARAEGRRVGLGFSTYIEAAPGPPKYFDNISPGFAAFVGAEPAYSVLEGDGTITVHTQQVPHGQGHETTLAQVAADKLGVPIDMVQVRYGDTGLAPFGIMGTGGSRSAAMAGGAVSIAADELRQRICDLAADLLEANAADLRIEGDNVYVAGVPSHGVTLAEVAAEARRRGGDSRGTAIGDEAIRVSAEWNGGEGGWAQSTHVCWVEVDLETGQVTIPRYLVVEDCGEIINPAIVEGQIRGGVAQGVGAVLYEKTIYSEDGQLQSGTFMDYLIPTVMEIPDIEIHHVETPSDIPFNYRGVGEGGMIGAPAAITNAIEDALSDLGVTIREQHLPPSRILELAGVIRAG